MSMAMEYDPHIPRRETRSSMIHQRLGFPLRCVFLLAACVLTIAWPLRAGQLPPTHIDDFVGHPRAIIISDMGNEPDDQMSFVRLLLYSNEIDLEALIATTSTWQKTATHPETMHAMVGAYGQVRPNLLLHAKGWPPAEDLDRIVFTGQSAYGLAATGPGKMSAGAEAILRAADRNDSRPLWICIWGGANTLAQALLHARTTRSPADLDKLVAELRVYSISDQDDAGPWIRREFPKLFYIVQPSTPTSGEYLYATWTGISGDAYYRNAVGADFSTVSNEWLDANVRGKGPLGKMYPQFMFIMEGDTPSYLNLIDNGLNSWRRPDWGGWGGRYIHRQPYGESHAIWTQGGDEFGRATSQDTVIGTDGRQYISDQASIWRWRPAFQNDFAARIDWTIADFAHANHNPIAIVNGQAGTTPITIDAEIGKSITLDASASSDPDAGQALQYRWFHYAEAGVADGNLADVILKPVPPSRSIDTPNVTVTATAACRAKWLPLGPLCQGPGIAHIILAVTDNGSPQLTSYRRIILNVH
jgi:Cellulose-binding Sde182, nucleoside hydrolase-like domain/Cellulose-binding protein Sde0182, C-terminal domain